MASPQKIVKTEGGKFEITINLILALSQHYQEIVNHISQGIKLEQKRQNQVTKCNKKCNGNLDSNMQRHLLARQAMQKSQNISKKVGCKVFGILTAALV